jgi:hypothetical protein
VKKIKLEEEKKVINRCAKWDQNMGGRTVFIRFGVLGDSLVGASGQLIGQILRRQQGRWWLDS